MDERRDSSFVVARMLNEDYVSMFRLSYMICYYVVLFIVHLLYTSDVGYCHPEAAMTLTADSLHLDQVCCKQSAGIDCIRQQTYYLNFRILQASLQALTGL